MTSTSVTTVGGLVVVTQVIPQDEKAIPMQAGAVTNATPAPPPATQTPPTAPAAPTKIDDMTATFLRGQPQGLGVVQIFLGVLCILFSLTALLSPILLIHAPFCLAVSFLISGSLAISASRKTSVKLVGVCLSWNLVSTLFGLVGVAYACFLLADGPASKRLCENCTRGMWTLDTCVYGSQGLLLVLLVLQVCVSITVSVFSLKALRRRSPSGSPVTVMVDDARAPLCSAASLSDSDVALLDSDYEGGN
ncbi:membrane-spanning 4-domains subfamily A member 4A [Halichoeres trimaculatus]|uniref:membrane-spanning 4-domains subfamily A member 4A n=1 Tax=Halichoeres trimaculatus TaxID=147232 RepID=UPI003D9E2EC6